jgi:CsoR family transcriptional regulator, copper-sensing transcriptional repressor
MYPLGVYSVVLGHITEPGEAMTVAAYGYLEDKDALIGRLHRIEGQVRGIERMVSEERYCIDILTQISAAATALDAIALRLLEGHVGSCVATALTSGDQAEAAAKSKELMAAVERFARAR